MLNARRDPKSAHHAKTRYNPRVPQRQAHRIVIGREGADLDLSDDDFVSTRHAVVSRDQTGRVTVEDLGSLNGTFVNNIRIYSPMRLYPGDQLRIGHKTVLIPPELFTAA